MTDKVYNVLFLCTGNSARSVLGEAIMNKLGDGRFRAYSAGSQPKGEVHPMALSVLSNLGFDTAGMRSKSWDEFAAPDAPKFDFISLFVTMPLAKPARFRSGIPSPRIGA